MAKTKEPDSRNDAADFLTECEQRLSTFRDDCGTALQDQLNRGFRYVEGILKDDSSPQDWIKGGLSLWIGSFATGQELYRSMYNLYVPQKDKE